MTIKKRLLLFILGSLLSCTSVAQPGLKYTRFFNQGHELYVLQDQYQKMMSDPANTPSELEALTERFNQHMFLHPEDKGLCFYLMGTLYRNVLPTTLRNPRQALAYYEHGLQESDGKDNRLHSYLHVNIASLYTVMVGYPSLYNAIHHLSEAVRLAPQRASMIGDYYLFGWGVKQDMKMAATFYNMSIHDGNGMTCNNLFYMLFLLDRDRMGSLDTVAEIYFEHAVYSMQIDRNWDTAAAWLYRAADRNFVPAYYELGVAMLNGTVPCRDRTCKDEAWQWVEKAVMQDYPPAVYDMAQHTKDMELMQHAADLGHPVAMEKLARYYNNRSRRSQPEHHNPELAAYWFLLSAQFCNAGLQSQFDSIVADENFTPEQITSLENRVMRHYSILREKRLKIIDNISNSPHYRTSRFLNSYYNHRKSLSRPPSDEEMMLSYAHIHETLYGLYCLQVERYIKQPGGYHSHQVDRLQQEMREVRLLANKIMPDAFPPSLWETQRPILK